MLSMNRRTSWCSWSRKYSAMVRPDSATLMRAPGGSFIWPNTSIVLARTPDSFISTHRSLPPRDSLHTLCTRAGGGPLVAAPEAVRRVHRDRPHAVVAEVLLDLAHEHLPAGVGADP